MQKEDLIILLHETLKFYSDSTNYNNDQIIKDNGYLARFAIDQIKKIDETISELKSEYDKFQNQINENLPNEIKKAIEDLKKQQ